DRLVAVDERDVDGKFAVALDELLRAVQRIDEPVTSPLRALGKGDAHRLLRQHWDVRRELPQALGDGSVRREIRLRQGRAILLVRNGKIRFVNLKDRTRCGTCDLTYWAQPRIERQRGGLRHGADSTQKAARCAVSKLFPEPRPERMTTAPGGKHPGCAFGLSGRDRQACSTGLRATARSQAAAQ